MRPRGDEGGHSELEEDTQRRHATRESVGKGDTELLKASTSPPPTEMAGLTDKLLEGLCKFKEASMKRINKRIGRAVLKAPPPPQLHRLPRTSENN